MVEEQNNVSNAVVSVFLMLALHFTVAPRGLAQQSDSAGNVRAVETEQAIAGIEAAHTSALLSGDLSALERIWAPDYQLIVPNGMAFTRDACLAMMKGRAVVYDRLTLQGLKVRIFGESAVVTGRIDVTGRAMGHILDGVDDFLTVYVKRDGRWQQVATHLLRVPGTTRSEGPVASR
jgi:Domain of unknown function (DUF4440)